MPEIHPSSIVSFSSEDKAYPASNLLTPSGFKKWKCEKPGEKSVVVEFQLPKVEQISQIDIGNEGSAFIEVLVRRSSGAADEYQCLLVSSSFMSPLDARSRTGLNRVRIFKTEKLTRAVAEQKWDRVRVVCSQPFSRTEQYGLSFIRFYSTETTESTDPVAGSSGVEKAKKQGTLAGFALRDEDSDDGEDKKDGRRLFTKAMEEKKKEEAKDDREPRAESSCISSQIRAATKVAQEELKKSRDEKMAVVKKANEAAGTSSSSVQRKRSSEEDEDVAGSSRPTAKRPRKNTPANKAAEGEPKKEEKRPSKALPKKDTTSSELNSLMRGVVFSLSGYQNPLRARLRDMATEMGAKYRADWGPNCTHLICAFVATPKYKEVSGKGRIVTDKWILECNKRRRLLPWRNFRLGRAPSPPGTDDESAPRRRRRPSPAAMRETDEEDEDEDEVLPSKNRKTPRKRGPINDDKSNDSEDSPDSDEELRRKKKARMMKRRKDGGDSEDEWKPSRADRKEDSDSEIDAMIDEDEDEDEMEEEEEEVMPKKKNRSREAPARAKPAATDRSEKKSPKKAMANNDVSDSGDEEQTNKATATQSTSPSKKKASALLDSGSDSEGDWAPIRRKKASPAKPTQAGDPNARSSDSPNSSRPRGSDVGKEEKVQEDSTRAELPSFFGTSTFFMYGKFKTGLERCLRRIVIAYGGKVEPYMRDNVKFVITSSAWDDNFDDALMSNSSLLFVRPQWLLDCDQKRRLVPYQKYQVVD